MARQLKYADQRGGGGRGDRGRRRAGARAWCSSRTSRSGRGSPRRSRRTRTGRRSRRRSRCRAPAWSRRCGRCWRGRADGRRPGVPRRARAWAPASRRLDGRGGAHPRRARLDRGDAGGAGGAAAGRGAARPLRRGHPRPRLRHPRRGGGDDAAPRLHRADRAAAHGRGRGAGALRLLRAGLAAAGGGLGPAAGVPAGGVRGLRGAATRRRTTPRCWG